MTMLVLPVVAASHVSFNSSSNPSICRRLSRRRRDRRLQILVDCFARLIQRRRRLDSAAAGAAAAAARFIIRYAAARWLEF